MELKILDIDFLSADGLVEFLMSMEMFATAQIITIRYRIINMLDKLPDCFISMAVFYACTPTDYLVGKFYIDFFDESQLFLIAQPDQIIGRQKNL